MNAKKIDILMVEDDPSTRRLVELTLLKSQEPVQFSVESAGSLAEGLDALAWQRFDLVLLDLGLPDSDGLATLEKLHDACPYMPIVVLTGLEGEEIGVQAIRNGASDYLVKGELGKDELVRAIRYVLERKKLEHKLRRSRERQRAILDNIQTGIILIDAANHMIVDVNRVAAEMIGAPAGGIIGQVCHDICPIPTGHSGHCPVSGLDENVGSSEQVLLTADGKKLPILKTVVPIVLGDREYLLESFVDICKHGQVGEELESNTEQLAHSNRVCVERELQVVGLKKKVNALLVELGREEQYGDLSDEELAATSTFAEIVTAQRAPENSDPNG